MAHDEKLATNKWKEEATSTQKRQINQRECSPLQLEERMNLFFFFYKNNLH